MGLGALFYPWGIALQAIAIVHFIRRRPETFWLWVILIGGGLGSLVYIAAEVIPDADLLRGSLNRFSRRRRIRALEALILVNPAVGNREELADLYLEEGQFARARELYDGVISPRFDAPGSIYRRGLAALEMGDASAAVADFERVVSKDPGTTSTAPSGCLRTPTAWRATPTKPTGCSRTPSPARRCRRRTTTTPRSSPRAGAPPKRGSTRRAFWPRSPRCRDTCAGVSIPGFERPRPCSSGSRLRDRRGSDCPGARGAARRPILTFPPGGQLP